MRCKICSTEYAGDAGTALCPACRKKLQLAAGSSSAIRTPEQRVPSVPPPPPVRPLLAAREVWRVEGSDSAHLKWPTAAVVLPSGELAVLDQPDQYRILRFGSDGKFLDLRASSPSGSEDGQLEDPQSLCGDADGNLYIADAGADRIAVWDARGKFQRNIGASGHSAGEFARPTDVQVDVDGCLHVADSFNHRIQKLSPDGFCFREIVDAGGWGKLKNPLSLALDGQQCLYVADEERGVVLKFSSEGVPLACWPDPSSQGVLFDHPCCVRMGPQGSVYVGDRGNRRVQRFSAAGVLLGGLEVPGENTEGGFFAVLGNHLVLPDRMNDRLLCLAFAD